MDINIHGGGTVGEDCAEPHPSMDSARFPAVVRFRKEHRKRLLFSHLIVNSIRNTFCELHGILAGNYVDVSGLLETTLDESFSNAQFMVDGFSLYRADRNIHGGGIMCYVKSDIPHRLRTDISCNGNGIEMITIQILIQGRKCVH